VSPEAVGGSHRLRLVVPGMPEALVVGDSCCLLISVWDAPAEALGAWPGVLQVEVDVEGGSIDLDL